MLLTGLVLLFAVIFYLSRDWLSFEKLAAQEVWLKSQLREHPLIVFFLAFLIYVIITGLSIPGATVLSLVYAWFFGFWPGLLLISLASTTGATVAFLTSRYLMREWVEQKMSDRAERIQSSFEREGPYYLFMLRLIPAFPFFVINIVMGLTRISTWTFWWVSQLGMLAGTAVYVYAGSTIPDLATLEADGIEAVFNRSQLTQFMLAFGLLGSFPLLVRWISGKRAPGNATDPQTSSAVEDSTGEKHQDSELSGE